MDTIPSPVPVRRHPDLFSEEEAATYLCLEGPRSLEWVREHFGLVNFVFGRRPVYHREDLDVAARRMTGRP